MAEYHKSRTVIEDVPVTKRPVVESEYNRVVEQRRGMSGATVAALIIAAVAATVLITLMIVNSNRESTAVRVNESAQPAAQPAQQQPSQPQVVVVPQAQPQTPAPPTVVTTPATQPAPTSASSSTDTPAVTDLNLEISVTSKLLDDNDLRGNVIEAKVSGGVATLAGQVPSEELKAKAERLAMSVKGVKRVVNKITVSSNQ